MSSKQLQVTKGEMIFTLLIGIILVIFLIGSLGLSPRARVLPLGVSLLGLSLVVLQIVKSYPHFKKDNKIKLPSLNWSLLYMILLVIIYPAIIWIAGYLVGSFLEVFTGLYILKFPNKKWIPVIAAVVSVAIYVTFSFLVQIHLPSGFFGLK